MAMLGSHTAFGRPTRQPPQHRFVAHDVERHLGQTLGHVGPGKFHPARFGPRLFPPPERRKSAPTVVSDAKSEPASGSEDS